MDLAYINLNEVMHGALNSIARIQTIITSCPGHAKQNEDGGEEPKKKIAPSTSSRDTLGFIDNLAESYFFFALVKVIEEQPNITESLVTSSIEIRTQSKVRMHLLQSLGR